MVWNQSRSVWECTFQDTVTGDVSVREAAVVISAVGTLDRPSIPEIAGAALFKGAAFHSARWDSSVKMEGKKVVVMGNGASATQFVPQLVKEVGPKGQVTQLVKGAHWWIKRVCGTCPELSRHDADTYNRAIRGTQNRSSWP